MIVLDELKEVVRELFKIDEEEADTIIKNMSSEHRQALAKIYKFCEQTKEELTQELEAAKQRLKEIEAQALKWLQSHNKDNKE